MLDRRSVLTGAIATLVVLALAGLVTLYAGWYDVSATSGHTGVTEWALGTLQHNSISARAGDLEVTLPTDTASLEHGYEHYDAMCVSCHGAPGVERGETGEGMTPTPPDLAEEAGEWSDAELFWITRHGIKLAGMPAFGPTHSDEEIAMIAAFVRRLPEMTPEEYAGWGTPDTAASDSASGGHSHSGDGHQHQH